MSVHGQAAPALGEEALRALSLARTSLLDHPGDTERAARMLKSALGWTFERALWFIQINSDYLPHTA